MCSRLTDRNGVYVGFGTNFNAVTFDLSLSTFGFTTSTSKCADEDIGGKELEAVANVSAVAKTVLRDAKD